MLYLKGTTEYAKPTCIEIAKRTGITDTQGFGMTSSSHENSPSAESARLQDLLNGLLRSLVDRPDALRIESETGDSGILLRVYVAPEDLGKVIGKQGRTARALRTLLSAVASKSNQRFSLDVLEG